jgi:ADP-ribosyl-[dinitrogen reductase] hydrolase
MTMTLLDRYRGCLLGLACGDAVGTTVEFCPRGSFSPLTDMVGGGPFALAPGQWTDDTSMALCLGTSLLEKGGFDPHDQMTRYLQWKNNGYLSSTGRCFDIGRTVRAALSRFESDGQPFAGSIAPETAGNGSLMRLAPVPLYYFPNVEDVVHFSAESSRTTHGAPEAVECCKLLGRLLCNALREREKSWVLPLGDLLLQEPWVAAIANGSYARKSRAEIVGSGYAVASLEAAIWCFHHTGSFEDAILEAANLGNDADTTAAITGQIAGAHYGIAGIPQAWLATLQMRPEIEAMADALHAASSKRRSPDSILNP